jgi:DNA-directed RNA polymerase specialized sigma24 family protein
VCGCVMRLIDTMPEAAATLLRRVELDDEPVVDIARAEGATANAVGVRLFRARKALRKRLQACCGECGDPTCHDCDCASA